MGFLIGRIIAEMPPQDFKTTRCTRMNLKHQEAIIRIGFRARLKGGQDFFVNDFKEHFTTMLLKPPKKG